MTAEAWTRPRKIVSLYVGRWEGDAHRKALQLVRVLADRDPQPYILSGREVDAAAYSLDYLRNGRGTTAIGTCSPRVRRGVSHRRSRYLVTH
jgi:DNA primase